MKHILSVDDFNHDFLQELIDRAAFIKDIRRNKNSNLTWSVLSGHLKNYLMITDFFEPSTRTRLSFEAAMTYLGGHVIGTENAAEFSSFKKGESIEDNFKVISGYCDVIVGRFLNEGEAHRAASSCQVPLINGGDGKGEHPTQALIDLFSIVEKFPNQEQLTVTFIGDNRRSRTVQSLARLLAGFDAVSNINFISPATLMVETEFLDDLQTRRVGSELVLQTSCLLDADWIKASNVVYMTRSQIERDNTGFHGFVFGPECAAILPENAIILHPLPRNSELPIEIDNDPRAYYFEQAWNGLYVRMALLEAICAKTAR